MRPISFLTLSGNSRIFTESAGKARQDRVVSPCVRGVRAGRSHAKTGRTGVQAALSNRNELSDVQRSSREDHDSQAWYSVSVRRCRVSVAESLDPIGMGGSPSG